MANEIIAKLTMTTEQMSAATPCIKNFDQTHMLSGEGWSSAKAQMGYHANIIAGATLAYGSMIIDSHSLRAAIGEGNVFENELIEDDIRAAIKFEMELNEERRREIKELQGHVRNAKYSHQRLYYLGKIQYIEGLIWIAEQIIAKENEKLDKIAAIIAATNALYSDCTPLFTAVQNALGAIANTWANGTFTPPSDLSWLDNLNALIEQGYHDILFGEGGAIDKDFLDWISNRDYMEMSDWEKELYDMMAAHLVSGNASVEDLQRVISAFEWWHDPAENGTHAQTLSVYLHVMLLERCLEGIATPEVMQQTMLLLHVLGMDDLRVGGEVSYENGAYIYSYIVPGILSDELRQVVVGPAMSGVDAYMKADNEGDAMMGNHLGVSFGETAWSNIASALGVEAATALIGAAVGPLSTVIDIFTSYGQATDTAQQAGQIMAVDDGGLVYADLGMYYVSGNDGNDFNHYTYLHLPGPDTADRIDAANQTYFDGAPVITLEAAITNPAGVSELLDNAKHGGTGK